MFEFRDWWSSNRLRIEVLENEIIRLKKFNVRPNIKPNSNPPDDNEPGSPGGLGEDDVDSKSEDSSSNNPKPKVDKPDESTPRQRAQPPCPPVSEE